MSRGSNHYQNQRERILAKLKAKRDAIVAGGGAALEELRRKEREARASYRRLHPEKIRAEDRGRSRTFKTALCASARFRARKRGVEATITPADLVWPTHCPVLGIELDYPERNGQRKDRPAQANWPSLDRFDSSKGYVPGNVFVISYRANTLKNNGTLEEMRAVCHYLHEGPGCGALPP